MMARITLSAIWTLATCLVPAAGAPLQAEQAASPSGVGAQAVLIRVTPTGEPASTAAPEARVFATVSSIEEALGKVAEHRRRAKRDLAIVIELEAGLHRVTRPIRIGPEHSGSAAKPLIIRGRGLGATVVRGSVELQEVATAPKSIIDGLPSDSLAHVKTFALPPDVSAAGQIDVPRLHYIAAKPVSFEVFDEAGALWPARWPNTGWARVEKAVDATTFTVTGSAAHSHFGQWKKEAELWVGGYWRWEWSYETQPVKAVDDVASTLQLTSQTHYGLAAGARFFVYHAASELDAPGEWFRDASTERLVLWPRTEVLNTATEVSVSASAFIIAAAHNVSIENLTIERFTGDAIRVLGSRDIVIADSSIRWAAGRAVSFLKSVNSGVRRCEITDTGEGGVLLSGGNRATLAPAGLFVDDSRIVRFSRLGRTYKTAVQIEGVGNRVARNFIADSTHMGIIFHGNDHRIEGNEITGVLSDTSDAGAIYSGRDWAARGTVISENFIHDLRPAPGFETMGVYIDDMEGGVTIRDNVFLRVDQPVFLGGGNDNDIEGNIFIASSPAIHIDGRGLTWASHEIANPESEVHRSLKAVPYTSPIWSSRYPALVNFLNDDPAIPKRNIMRNNLMVGSKPYRFLKEVDRSRQVIGPDFSVDPVPLGAATASSAAALLAALDRLLQRAELRGARHALLERANAAPALAGEVKTPLAASKRQ